MAEQSNAPNTLVVVDTEEWRRVKTRQYNKDYKRKRNAMKPKNRKGPMPKPETTARMSEGAPNCHAARQRNYRERIKQRLAAHAEDVAAPTDIAPPEAESVGATHQVAPEVVASEPVGNPTIEQSQALPLPKFSLLAELHVPISVSAAQIFCLCEQRTNNPVDYKPVFDENPPVPVRRSAPRIKLPPETLLQKTPVVTVSSEVVANGDELKHYCCAQDVVVVRGMMHTLGVDLDVFSTQQLIQDAPDFKIDTLEQPYVPGDANVGNLAGPTWKFTQSEGRSTIAAYGSKQLAWITEYGAESTEPAVKKRKMRKSTSGGAKSVVKVQFASNIDLVDKALFTAQIQELEKLPAFCAPKSNRDLLAYLDYDILGMSQPQLYMKMPGCRTPGHLENNCVASINVNVGPGDCEWFAVAYEHWPAVDDLCKRNGLDFFRKAWWPQIDDLVEAGIPYHRFTQRPGDLVWVGLGCVHWVQAIGPTNNVSWNVGPMEGAQLRIATFSYEWNRSIQYRSLVPLEHLSWQLARRVKFEDEETFKLVKGIMVRSLAYSRMIADIVHANNLPISMQPRVQAEVAPSCRRCKAEVFNLLFTKENKSGKYDVFCAQCACASGVNEYSVLQQYTFADLCSVFDQFHF